MPNVFQDLSRWARRHEENFLTESFAVLLKVLAAHDYPVFARVISILTGDESDMFGRVSVRSQIRFGIGVADLIIQTGDRQVVVEVKKEAGLHGPQLDEYLRACQKNAQIVLLSRYHIRDVPLAVRCVRWHDIAIALRKSEFSSEESRVIGRQFIEFLKVRNMTFEPVGDLASSLGSLLSFTRMLSDAIEREGERARPALRIGEGHEDPFVGVEFGPKGKDGAHSIGVYANDPDILWLQSGPGRISVQGWKKAGIGDLDEEEKDVWFAAVNLRDLAQTGQHFMALSTGSFYDKDEAEQFRLIREFVTRGLRALSLTWKPAA